jgi:DNA-binding GntR family transcriptional regulator
MAEDSSTAGLLASVVAREPSTAAPARSLLREEVYVRIRTWIVEGLLPPGTQLRDKDIAEALQVSRTPVREALRRLQDEQLVIAEASRWTKVAPVDTAQASRVYPIIWTLERLAVSLADEWGQDRIAALRLANDRVAAAVERREAEAASAADAEFHGLLAEAAGNQELSAILRDLRVQLRRLEIAYFGGTLTAERSVREHERIVAALESGDIETAGEEIERNWRVSLEWVSERQASAGRPMQ